MRTSSKRNELAQVDGQFFIVLSVRIGSERSPYFFTLLSLEKLLCDLV